MAVRSCQIGSFYSPTKKNLKTRTRTHHEAIQSLRRHTDRTSDIPERFMVQIQFRNTQTNVIRITHTQKILLIEVVHHVRPGYLRMPGAFFIAKKRLNHVHTLKLLSIEKLYKLAWVKLCIILISHENNFFDTTIT